MVEHGTENAGVDSSSLSLGTIPLFSYLGERKKGGFDNIGVRVGRRMNPDGNPNGHTKSWFRSEFRLA